MAVFYDRIIKKKNTNLYKHTMQDFRNAIVVMCNKYQIEVLDLFTVTQFEWLKKVQEKYPNLKFHMYFLDEGMGFSGTAATKIDNDNKPYIDLF